MCTTQGRFLGADSSARPGPKAPLGSSRQGSQTPCPGHLSSPSSATHAHSITTSIVRSLQPPDAETRGTPFPGAQLLSQASGHGGLAAPAAHVDVAPQRRCPQLLLTPVGVSKSAAQRGSTEASAPLYLPISLSSLPSMETSSLSLPSIFKTD